MKERTGCYICGQIGHIKMDCPSNQSDSTVGGLNGAAWDHDRSAVECYGCGKYGHIRSDCPNERRDGGSQRPSREHRHHRVSINLSGFVMFLELKQVFPGGQEPGVQPKFVLHHRRMQGCQSSVNLRISVFFILLRKMCILLQ